MRAKQHTFAALAACGLLLTACDAGGADGPGSVSVDEAEALDDAAEMLEERRLPEGALPEVVPAQEAPQEEQG